MALLGWRCPSSPIADFFSRPGPTVPEVTLDGTTNNLLACTTSACMQKRFPDYASLVAYTD